MIEIIAPPLITAALGAGVFIRLVAKEKHRREKYLQFRLEEQIRKINEEKELEKQKIEQAKADAEAAEKAKQEGSEKGTDTDQATAVPDEQPS